MPKFIDLTNCKFGRLTVTRRASNKGNQTRWYCDCECGTKNHISHSSNLRNGTCKSCGCLQKEKARENAKKSHKVNTYDLSGEYGIGYTGNGKEFWFDLEDYEKIKDYTWGYTGQYVKANVKNENGAYSHLALHRFVMNAKPNEHIDHINHPARYEDKYDNRKCNLRVVTYSQNRRNSHLGKNNTSGYKGVRWYKKGNKWSAQITVNKKQIHLGYFTDLNEAIEARKEAEIKYFGEYMFITETG